jgi:hypothetical protein
MDIIILGIDHQIQRPFYSTDTDARDFARQQKARFADLIRIEIRQNRIRFVGEEANRTEDSIVEAVCLEENCRYLNIEMSVEKREQRRIPMQYNESKEISDAEKARGNREREAHMVEEVLINAPDPSNVLVVCGSKHSNALADRYQCYIG